jgi:restriction endonuclease
MSTSSLAGGTASFGQDIGARGNDIWRTQIRQIIKQHPDKELGLTDRGINVLGLVFVHRVQNYREGPDDGSTTPGK